MTTPVASGHALRARKALDTYRRETAKAVEDLRYIETHYREDLREEKQRALQRQLEARYAALMRELRALVADSHDAEKALRPSERQRDAAMSRANVERAAHVRQLAQHAPMAELLAMAEHAVQQRDDVALYVIRMEATGRPPSADGQVSAITSQIVRTAFALGADLHVRALADVVGAQYILARATLGGPMGDDAAARMADPVRSLSAYREATSYRNEFGVTVALRESDAETLLRMSGAKDQTDSDDADAQAVREAMRLHAVSGLDDLLTAGDRTAVGAAAG